MSAHISLNLRSELRKRDKKSFSRNQFDKLYKTRDVMLDSFKHMALKLL